MAYSGRSGARKSGGNRGNSGRSGSRDSKPSWKRGGSGVSRGDDDDRPSFKRKSSGDKKYGDKPGFKKSSGSSDDKERGFVKKTFGDKPAFRKRREEGDDRRSAGSGSRGGSGKKPFGDKPAFRKRREDGDDRPAFKKKSFGDKPFKRRSEEGGEEHRPYAKKPFGDKPAFRNRREEGDDRGPARGGSFGKKSFGGDKPTFRKRTEEGGDDRPAFRDGFKKKPFAGSKGGFRKPSDRGERGAKPTWKKGGRDERSSAPKKRSEEGSGEWETFDSSEKASSYVKENAPRKPHRGRADYGTVGENDGKIRLNKYIANTGLCSRREADDMIEAGVIKVNGKIVTELGTKVSPTDIVHYGDQPLKREKLVYILLNKPKDYITTTDDPQERKTVLDLIEGAGDERVYPVGRLDRNTTGVLLLTNDGDLAERLMHPKYGVEKIYQVSLDMNLRKEDFDKIMTGVELEDGFIKADDMSFVGDGADHKEVGIVLHSGRNRIVRRLFEHLGYEVRHLDRVGYAGLTKKNVPKGKWRFLEPREVGFLKMKVGGERKRSRS